MSWWGRLPNGENPADVANRVKTGIISSIMRDTRGAVDRAGVRNAIIVSHGVTIKAFVKKWFKYSHEWFQTQGDMRCNPPNCSIYHISGSRPTNDEGFYFGGFESTRTQKTFLRKLFSNSIVKTFAEGDEVEVNVIGKWYYATITKRPSSPKEGYTVEWTKCKHVADEQIDGNPDDIKIMRVGYFCEDCEANNGKLPTRKLLKNGKWSSKMGEDFDVSKIRPTGFKYFPNQREVTLEMRQQLAKLETKIFRKKNAEEQLSEYPEELKAEEAKRLDVEIADLKRKIADENLTQPMTKADLEKQLKKIYPETEQYDNALKAIWDLDQTDLKPYAECLEKSWDQYFNFAEKLKNNWDAMRRCYVAQTLQRNYRMYAQPLHELIEEKSINEEDIGELNEKLKISRKRYAKTMEDYYGDKCHKRGSTGTALIKNEI